MAEKVTIENISQFARDFVNNPLNSDLRTVPGIGPSGIAKLKLHYITTTEQLVGQFFLCNRDEEQFRRYLIDDIGILDHRSRETARMFCLKFSGI